VDTLLRVLWLKLFEEMEGRGREFCSTFFHFQGNVDLGAVNIKQNEKNRIRPEHQEIWLGNMH
jgi:hypothetical protein